MSAIQRLGTGVSAEFAQKNTNTPVNPTDLANKAYVDAVAQGLTVKGSCLVATAAALPAYTYNNGSSGVGATITANANGALTVDGVTGFSVGDRILVKDETAGNAPYNGIYTVTAAGGVGSPFVLTRATDNDQAAEFPGAFTFIESGTVNSGAGFVCTNTSVTVGTTAIVWTQFSGLGEVTAGNGLTKTGNTLNVGAGDGIQSDADSVTVKLDGASLSKSGSGLKLSDNLLIGAIEIVFNGGGSVLTVDSKLDYGAPAGFTILEATLLADQSGSVVVNIWKDTYANYPPTVADKITSTTPPTISSSDKSTDSTLSGWTTTVNAGDTLRFNIDSVTTITRVTLILKIKKTP